MDITINLDDLDDVDRKTLGIKSREEYEEYQERIERFYDLIYDLEEDWDQATWELEIIEDEQFRRRTLIRTLFAVIEGTIFALKHLLLEEHRVGILDLSPAEYAVLAEESYRVDQRGKLRGSVRYPSLKGNIKFTFSMYALARGASSEFTKPLAEDSRWQSFCNAIDIRNRLMHPKSADDLIVSDLEWKDVQASREWFFEQHEHLRRIDSQAFLESLVKYAKQHPDGEIQITDEAKEA
jgi:hypothetical protein